MATKLSGLCESSDFECKCHKMDFFFSLSSCLNFCMYRRVHTGTFNLLNECTGEYHYDTSKHGLGRKGPVQATYVNEIKKLINTEFYFLSP